MDLWKKIKGELIDIVQWLDDSRDTLVYRFERMDNEIKNGAKLVVREGQAAVFVNEGKLADVFQPGTYTLSTQNLPILATLKGWKYGFESPFKAEVYFVNTRQFTDQKWGTMNPIMLRDAEFGPVRLRAFGTYAMKVVDPGALVKEIAGTSGRLTAEGLSDQVRNFIVSRFSEVLGESKIPALDLAANYSELGGFMLERVKPGITPYGIDLMALLVENISLPPEVEQALDSRTKMGCDRQSRCVHEVPGRGSDEGSSQEPERHGGRRNGNGDGIRNGESDGPEHGQRSGRAAAGPRECGVVLYRGKRAADRAV
jgi:membrane protease subunit (stomatin/prohibitin family)